MELPLSDKERYIDGFPAVSEFMTQKFA